MKQRDGVEVGDEVIDPAAEQALRRRDWERPAPTLDPERPAPWQSRAEAAAGLLAAIAAKTPSGERMGAKEELRMRCQVSVGTFNEAVRIAQSRGVISSRPGQGGGVFAAQQSPMSRLAHSVLALDSQSTSKSDAYRIRDALVPAVVEDAIENASPADLAALRGIRLAMSGAIEQGNASGFAEGERQFHARLSGLSPNFLLRTLYELAVELTDARAPNVASAERTELEVDALKLRLATLSGVLDALVSRDAAEAKRFLLARKTHDTRPPKRRTHG